ncbi:MAG: ABC transporter permease, partial [Bacteroidetes bacterium]|nr:ABC transporter permease [Bacteroidota bacterium]
MLKNYIKIAFRNIFRDRVYSFINVAGLSVGLASTFIILIYSFNQLSYDSYNKKLDRICLVTTHLPAFNWTEATTPYPLGPAMKDHFPEVKASARWGESSGCSIEYDGRQFGQVRCVSADPSIFRILSFPILSGSLTEVFDGKSAAVISKGMAQRIFGTKDPVGKVITIRWERTSYNLNVAAVMKDVPAASTIRADAVVPLFVSENSIKKAWSHVDKAPLESWNLQPIQTYVLLSSAHAASQLDKHLVGFSRSHSDPNNPSSFHLYPLKDVYFGAGNFVNSIFPTGDKKVVDIYLAIALLTLLIACLNFVILGTSRTGIRTKEMGVRKVVGASRWHLVGQVMTESVLTSLLSLPVSLLFVEIFLPHITSLLGESLPSSYLDSFSVIAVFAAIAIIVGIVSGSYVSFYLSSLHPVDILRSKPAIGSSKGTFIRVLVVIEMVIFTGLISASVTIYRQLSYFNHRNLGFDKKNLLVFYSNPKDLKGSFSAFRSE